MFVSSLRSSPACVAGRLLVSWLVLVCSLSLLVPAAQAQSYANDGFDPRPDSLVNAVAVQPDGRLLVGGQFGKFTPNNSTVGTTRYNFARINIDGTVDLTFAPAIVDNVSAIAVQGDGRILVATYTRPIDSSKATGRIIRLLPDGGIDSTFAFGIGSDVYTATRINSVVVQSNGKILVGGYFTTIRPNGLADAAPSVARNNLVRLNADGSVDSTFTPEADNIVTAITLQGDGNILVGGGFNTLKIGGTSTAAVRLVRLTSAGALDSTFAPEPNDLVNAITIGLDGKIYVGGSFTKIGGAADTTVLARLARLNSNGTYDTTFTPTVNGAVLALAVETDGRVLAGGTFTTVAATTSGVAVSAPHIARFRTDGTIDTAFEAIPDEDVTQISVLPDARIVIAGRFGLISAAGLQTYGRISIARLLATGIPDVTFEPNYSALYSDAVTQVVGGTTSLIVTGSFNSIGGTTHSNIARVSADTGTIDPNFTATVNGRVAVAVVESDGSVIIGGTFTKVNGVTRAFLARLTNTGAVDTTYDPNPSGAVTALALQSDGKLLVGGEFLTFAPNGATATTSRYYIARLAKDGSVDTTFDPHANSSIAQFVVQSDGKIIIVGAFTSLQPGATGSIFSRSYLARLTADGKVDEEFSVFTDQPVRVAAVQGDGKILLGGAFTAIVPSGSKTAVTRYYLVRLDSKGVIDTSFQSEVDNVVATIAVQGDGKIVVGGFFIRARKNATDEIDDPANPGQKIKGPWTSRQRLVRFNTDGSVDSTFEASANNAVSRLIPHSKPSSSGGFLVFGAFSTLADSLTAAPVYSPVFGRVGSDGKVDTNYVFAPSAASGEVHAIVELLDSRLLVGGSFTGLAGAPGSQLVRVRANGTADTAFEPKPLGGGADVRALVALPPREVESALTRPFVFLGSNAQLFPGFAPNAGLGMTGTVYTAFVQADGKVVVGGSFQLNGSSTLKNLVRFNRDGSLDTAFAPEPNAAVHLIKDAGSNRLWIGGEFSGFGSATSAETSYFVRMLADGSIDGTVKVRPTGDVRSLVVQSDGKVVIGGLFTSIQAGVTAPTSATARTYIARLNLTATDATLDADFNPTANGGVFAMGLVGDKIVIGGSFTSLQPNGATTATARSYLARLNAAGTIDTDWDPKPNGIINALVVQSDGKVVVGGAFGTFEPKPATGTAVIVTRQLLARILTTGLIDTDYQPNPNNYVYGLALGTDDSLVVTGAFTEIAGVVRNRVARLDKNGVVVTAFNPNANAPVNVAVIAKVDGIDGVVLGGSFDLVQPFGTILVGGDFTSVGSGAAKNLVRLNSDGNLDSTFLPDPDKKVNAIVRLADGSVIVGGQFTTISGTARNRLARYKADGTLDTAFNPGVTGDADAAVNTLALRADGKILVGGKFTTIAGATRNNLAQLNADGTLDTGFTPQTNGAVASIAVRGDGKILVGGEFTTLNGSSRANAGLLGSDGSLDGTFNPALDGRVNAIVVRADNGFYLGGAFTKSGSTTRNRIARFTAAGVLETTFNPGADAEVTALTIASDGKLLAGGKFSVVGGVRRNLIGRIAVSEVANNRVTYNPSGGVVSWVIDGSLPTPSSVYFEKSSDDRTWTSLGNGTRSSGGNWQVSGVSLTETSIVLLRARGSTNGASSSYGFLEGRGSYVAGTVPTLVIPPTLIAVTGSAFTFSPVSGSTYGALFTATGLPAGLSIDPLTGVVSGTISTAGNYTFTVKGTKGGTEVTATYTVSVFSAGTSSRLVALSVRTGLSGGSSVTPGFSITGTGSKSVLIRGAGPALGPYGVTNFAARPQFALQTLSGTPLTSNAGWAGDPTLASLFTALGAFPFSTSSLDAAAATTLATGLYTVTGSSVTSETGVALFEVYDASPTRLTDAASFRSLSVRGPAGTGDNTLIAGVTIAGSTAKRLLIRAVGPTLTGFGVTGALADPKVEVYSSTNLLASNDDWGSRATGGGVSLTPAQVETLSGTIGAFALPTGSKDAVVVIDLGPGVYTMQATGVGSTTGITLIEVYDVTP